MATILIVDNRPDHRERLTTLLGGAGHEPLEAATAQEGLAIARAQPLDLIVTEIVLPSMDGYEFAQTVRADPQLQQTPVVFHTSAYIEAEARRLAQACGVAHLIVKPAPTEAILQTIDRALRSPPAPVPLPASEAFHQEQMRLLNDKLAAKVDELEAEVADRQQVEHALRSSEAELRALFAAIRDVIVVVDADGNYLKIAPTNPRSASRPVPLLPGRRLHDSFPSDLADQFVAHIRRALVTRQPVPFEYSQVIDHETVWFEADMSPLAANVAFMVARDNTARKQAETAEHESEAHLRALFENAPISIWEEDFSEVKTYLDNLPVGPEGRLSEYLDDHPEVVAACIRLVKLIAVNQATLELMEAPNQTDLSGGLAMALLPESRAVFHQVLIAIMHGVRRLKLDASVGTRANQRREVTLNWSVVPGHEQDYSRVILSLVDISERKRAERETARQLERLRALRSIDMAIGASLDLPKTLEIVLDQVIAQLQVDGADLFLINPANQSVDYAGGRGFRSAMKPTLSLQLGQDYAGRVALERRTLAVPDFDQHRTNALRVASLYEEGFRAYFGVPLLARGQLTGVLEVFHRAPLQPNADWLNFLESLAGQAAIAIDNAALVHELQRSNQNLNLAYDATIEGWSRALDLRDRETEGHSQRVTEMSLRLATQMGVDAETYKHIRHGALLHDIGKMGIPDRILLKPGPLTSDEWTIMRQHPVFAYNLLSPILYLHPALDIPYCHHERWDGAGYPRHLKATDIPLAARIFAVVDEWDALRSDRPYRPGWPEPAVREHIRSQTGKHFDPMVVEAFEQLMDQAQ